MSPQASTPGAVALDLLSCPLQGISLIEASAGTGKTWHICGLYLRLLLEKQCTVQQILVVTFTKAATAELRERIRARIVDALQCLRNGTDSAANAPDPFLAALLTRLRAGPGLGDRLMEERLHAALQNFDEAAIFTIHGFCHRVLADAPFTAGVPMSVEAIADDAPLRMQVVHDYWRRHLAAQGLAPDLAGYLLADRRNSPAAWGALLKRRCAKPLSRMIWPAALDAPPRVDGQGLRSAHAAARALWHADRAAILDCVMEALPRLSRTSYKPAAVASAAADWDRLLGDEDAFSNLAREDKLALLTTPKLKPNAKLAPPRYHEFFDRAAQLLDLRASTMQALELQRLVLVRRLLEEGPVELRQTKQRLRVYAYDDLLQSVHERLTGAAAPWLAAALRERFPAALIDEFQDTDPLQFAIFRQIYAGHPAPLFLVGDPKQAIYSFRGADLHTYLRARHEAQCEYSLGDNQRSTRDLVQGVNALFEANPRAFLLPGLDYRAVGLGQKPRPILHDRTQPRSALQLWQLPVGADPAPQRKRFAQSAAARACAGEIARLLGAAQKGAITLDGQPLSAGNIAVLVRSHKLASVMRSALAALGVGSVTQSQESIHDSQDSAELERVLLAVFEPAREGLLRAALATEFMGLDAAAIEAVSADEGRMLEFMARFGNYRQTWLQRGVGVMLRQWMLDEQVGERLLQRADGQRRLTNLLHLAECLQQAAQEHPTPEAQLRWLQLQRGAAQSDDALQLRLESDRNLVQILTIHKSKGLEYPIVFCPFLWDGHPGGSSGSLEGKEYHDDRGLAVIDFGPEDPATKEKIKLERAAESLRQIYVTLTRAVHRCYIVVGNYTSKGATTEGGKSLLNWLVGGQDMSPAQWLEAGIKPQAVTAAWHAFAARNAPQVGLDPLPLAAIPPLPAVQSAADTLQALPAPQRIPAGWRLGSYSSLTLGVRQEGSAADHDLRLTGTTALAAAGSGQLAPDDILNFARGAAAGTCLHKVFERADFTDPSTWGAAIDGALRAHPQGPRNAESAALQARMLQGMLANVLHTPLHSGIRLKDLAGSRRLVELEFSLVAPQLDAASLIAMMQSHGYPAPALSFARLQGYLRGFIDLVFERQGRYYILDWKSNHLGSTPADYGPAALDAAMRAHAYHLQYLLYALALHRYLQRRLAGYDFERHFGGVFYLFVRGVRPHWKNADGSSCGVFHDRPQRPVLEALARELDPSQVTA